MEQCQIRPLLSQERNTRNDSHQHLSTSVQNGIAIRLHVFTSPPLCAYKVTLSVFFEVKENDFFLNLTLLELKSENASDICVMLMMSIAVICPVERTATLV